jgi:hypothetical protein
MKKIENSNTYNKKNEKKLTLSVAFDLIDTPISSGITTAKKA